MNGKIKGLAWYTTICMIILFVALLEEIIQGIEISTNVWAIVLYIPVFIFSIMVIKEKQ